jgi:hypothetical protein
MAPTPPTSASSAGSSMKEPCGSIQPDSTLNGVSSRRQAATGKEQTIGIAAGKPRGTEVKVDSGE